MDFVLLMRLFDSSRLFGKYERRVWMPRDLRDMSLGYQFVLKMGE
jgi:hypothetical protein